MRILYFLNIFLLFLSVSNSYAQELISGKIVAEDNKDSVLANAVILTNHHRVFFTNHDGDFAFEAEAGERINQIFASGFSSKEKPISIEGLFLLNRISSNKISKVEDSEVVNFKSKQVQNSNFSFRSLSKTRIENTKNNNQNSDFVFRKHADFTLTSEKGLQQNINAIGVDGLEGVVPKTVNKDLHSFNWFKDYFQVFEQTFISPFHILNRSYYEFSLLFEDSQIKIISFQPDLNNALRSFHGVFVIDKLADKIGQIQVTFNHDFKFTLQTEFNLDFGLPEEFNLNIKPGTGGTKLSFFGGGLDFGRIQNKNVNKSPKTELFHKQIFFDFDSGENISPIDSRFSKILESRTETVPLNYWTKFEPNFISNVQQNQDSLNVFLEQKKVKARVNRISAFEEGFFPIGMLDVDLTRLIKINNYEGLRAGLGLQTNHKFSERFRLGGYGAYGTKDTNFKYGFNSGVLLTSDTNTWLNAYYDNDIQEVGMNNFLTDARVYSIFEPRLVNITFFYKYEKYGLGLQHSFTPQVMSEFRVNTSRISQTRAYNFVIGEDSFRGYRITSGTFGLRWMPNYTFSKIGPRTYIDDKDSPVISAQMTQAFANILEGDFDFTKVSAKIDYKWKHFNGSSTEFNLQGDLAFGQVPLTHSFHAFPNSPNKFGIFDRFSVAGVKSFETMYFNEFFSTKLASLHMKHSLPPFKFSNTIQPEFVMISRHAIGDFENQGRHQNINFNTLSEGYNELGFEFNKIFAGFGLSFAYRYGAYHLPNLEDNISFKFTFYLKL
ncbi:hypothetical protein [Psychroflexus aestuariivivens]|uniref:hypothetical protein n=1 Tax=Psychroflexus aestuariivivens TaxID=1795040 RepID=UPI000FD95411|nr:hypothetical protein [Psychroflexus aestuariivivens]